MKREINESVSDYLKRLYAAGDAAVSNLDKTFKEMKQNNIIGFCNKCGCDLYKDIKHKCK